MTNRLNSLDRPGADRAFGTAVLSRAAVLPTTNAETAGGRHAVRGEHGLRRARSIRWAVGTSALSKALGMVVQLMAIPVALRALGTGRYAAFLALTSALAWINVAQLGVGPGLTRHIAAAAARGDRRMEAQLFTTSLVCVGSPVLVLLAAALALVSAYPMPALFGPQFAPYAGEMRGAAVVVACLVSAQIVLGVVEAAQTGYQEQHVNNVASCAANVLSIALLLAAAWRWRTIAGLTLAVYGSFVLARSAMAGRLVLVARPYLRPRASAFRAGLVRAIAGTGMAFFLVQVASLLEQQSGVLLLGRLSGPVQLATYAVCARVLAMAGMAVGMITQPMWPAYMDAVARGEWAWARRAFRRSLRALMLYASAAGLAFACFGLPVVNAALRVHLEPSPALQAALGVYFIANMWVHIHYMYLTGIGELWPAAVTLLGENLVLVALAVPLVRALPACGIGLAYLLASLSVSTWILPCLVRRAQRRLEAAHG